MITLYPASSPSPQDAITRCLSGGRSMVYSAQTSMQNIKYVRIGRPRRRLYQDPSYDDGRVAMNSSQQNGRDSTSTDRSHGQRRLLLITITYMRLDYNDFGPDPSLGALLWRPRDLSQTTRGSRVQGEEGNSSHQALRAHATNNKSINYKLPRQCSRRSPKRWST